ncbi:MAG: GNAT family N-acetyltransferase [Lachnospiraceae bacterium]|nr:GNAT family N-acetyltransferase [Lachnospiraceae bacterium]
MKTGRDYLKELYGYALQNGFEKASFLSKRNMDRFIETTVDGYSDYPLVLHDFGGRFNEKALRTMRQMFSLDFRTRLRTTAGLACSGRFESVLTAEPPMTEQTGLLQYLKASKAGDYLLMLKPSFYRQDAYERFALKKRQPYMDDNTWYIYIFVTKKNYQKRGYGKKLLSLMCSYADKYGYRICLETDLEDNVALYEHFGFHLMDASVYKNRLKHFVMLY